MAPCGRVPMWAFCDFLQEHAVPKAGQVFGWFDCGIVWTLTDHGESLVEKCARNGDAEHVVGHPAEVVRLVLPHHPVQRRA